MTLHSPSRQAVSWDAICATITSLRKEAERELHIGEPANGAKFWPSHTEETSKIGFRLQAHEGGSLGTSVAEFFLRSAQTPSIGSLEVNATHRGTITLNSADVCGGADFISMPCDTPEQLAETKQRIEEEIGNWILHMSVLNLDKRQPAKPAQPQAMPATDAHPA